MCETCGGHGPGHDAEAGHRDRYPGPDAGAAASAGSRIVVVGKGGVGKSTVTALLARILARQGLRVVAVDADEQRNLAATLGIDPAEASAIVPVADEANYVEEKTGVRPGEGAGGMLRLNPDTTDLVDRLSVTAPDGVRLVVMGGVRQAGGGCLCPETALVSTAVAGMHLHHDDVVLMDTHAGVEHFGRALARGFDSALVVVEPTFNAIQVGLDSARMAAELGIASLHLVINRTRSDVDVGRALGHLERLGGFPYASIWTLPYDEMAVACEPAVDRLLEGSPLVDAVGQLVGLVLVRTEPPDGSYQHHSHDPHQQRAEVGV